MLSAMSAKNNLAAFPIFPNPVTGNIPLIIFDDIFGRVVILNDDFAAIGRHLNDIAPLTRMQHVPAMTGAEYGGTGTIAHIAVVIITVKYVILAILGGNLRHRHHRPVIGIAGGTDITWPIIHVDKGSIGIFIDQPARRRPADADKGFHLALPAQPLNSRRVKIR